MTTHRPILAAEAVVGLVWLALVGCEAKKTPTPDPDGDLPGAMRIGRKMVERYECNRCHQVADRGLSEAPMEKDCRGCHQAIHGGFFDNGSYRPEAVAEWKRNVVHLRVVPSLTALEHRFYRDWLVRWLQRPHDLRPRLASQMPWMPIEPQEAEAIADYFIPEPTPEEWPLQGGDVDRGRELFGARGCATCHGFTGAPVPEASGVVPEGLEGRALAEAMMLAPDLRYTRDRMRPSALLRWLEGPSRVKPDTAMPDIPLSDGERLDLAAYVLRVPLEQPAPVVVPERLPPLKRPVRWAEVEQKVFKKICWHCHSVPDEEINGNDGGPGNTGGLGFAGKGLELGTYEGVVAGALEADGTRRSVLEAPAPGQPPPLIEHMMLRHREVAGRPDATRRGMPLGLSPMSLEEIRLVESWIVQGYPRE